MNVYDKDLASLVGFKVKIVIPGPNTINGILISLKPDHLVLYQDDSVIYLKLDKLKEITKNTKSIKPEEIQDFKFVEKPIFNNLLEQYVDAWLSLRRDGADEIQGVLVNANESHVTFIVNDEITFIPTSQITGITTDQMTLDDSDKKTEISKMNTKNSETELEEKKNNQVSTKESKDLSNHKEPSEKQATKPTSKNGSNENKSNKKENQKKLAAIAEKLKDPKGTNQEGTTSEPVKKEKEDKNSVKSKHISNNQKLNSSKDSYENKGKAKSKQNKGVSSTLVNDDKNNSLKPKENNIKSQKTKKKRRGYRKCCVRRRKSS